jgi:uncharacterized damage-inducible protein DinB
VNQDIAIRDQVAKLLDWGDAHVTFEKGVAGIAPRFRGVIPPGLEHSPWQLVEHLRIAQADILEFCRSAKYEEKKWPDDYWPKSAAPRTAAAWKASIAAFRRDRRALQQLAKDRTIDLFAQIPHGTGQTYVREILLIADHTAYHLGQLILVRRALGIWP